MKKAKRAASLALALLLAAALLTGCGSSEAEMKKLVGVWTMAYDISGDILDGLDDGLEEYFDFEGISLGLTLRLSEDGTYTLGVEQPELDRLLEALKPVFRDGTIAYTQAMIAAAGLDMTSEEILQQSGSSLDALVDEMLSGTETALDEMADELSVSGKWKAAGGKLYTTESMDDELDESSYERYELDGDTLTVFSNTGDGQDMLFTRAG